MKKFPLIITLVTVIIILGGIFLFGKKEAAPQNTSNLPENLEYYWGDGCPHCKNVNDFVESWPKKDSVKIEKYEVWKNQSNALKLKTRYEYCGVPANQMGVPLLFTPEGKCYSGDTPIIDYLKSL